MSINFSDIAIWKVYSVDYHCIITRINESEAVSLLQKADL